MKCNTCRFWMAGEEVYENKCPDGFGHCANYDKLERAKFISEGRFAADMLITENDEGWGFWTGPDFGCIHHARPEPNGGPK